ncbi:BTB/POZ domain-containing protein KCTD19 isoform X2 [Numida meleagris]|uniref:BTB/POZ domain-containing protein KCTD19 isoform X2 n=1 Tax=Numida meleagris TaxID=8996 RepID=UPI000B3E2E1C|nr:BTB/POZ domain-containing protein KCTD19 isoform X2 [Numida meleagris]
MEPESAAESAEEESINFNVGGWYFSLPRSKVAQFPDSLLWKEASVQEWSENLRLFIDQDGFIFRHLHSYMQTSKLSSFCCAELNLLYEQALVLQLTPLIQILGSLKEDSSCVQPADIPVAERVPLNYWRTQKCANKPPEIPPKSSVFTGLHERTPLGLVDTPLLDTEEEVNYCFLPLDLVRKYPVLVNDDNLLWLLENAALIECDYSEFRFIVNFLRSKKMLLPDDFSNIDTLEKEALVLGIPELIEAVRIYRGGVAARRGAGGRRGRAGRRAARYALALGLLQHYPDSALGQLLVGSDPSRHRLHVCGSGVLFQHARNWLGTCRLPLTENISEIQELCAHLDKGDITYEPMKDALKCYLKQQVPSESRDYNADWTAEVSVCTLHQIVKVYVGSNWYETYLKTLLKYPELLSNDKKVCWITYGQSLLIHGDGQMFRHVLNFLRLGKLFLPAEFKEWPLFCQEAEEYQIPSLLEALYCCDAYRLWIQNKELRNEDYFLCRVPWNKEHEFSRDSREVYSRAAVDSSRPYIDTWSNIKYLKGKRDTSGAKAKPPRMVPQVGGTKRKNAAGGDNESSASTVKCSVHLESPPRKRGTRSGFVKQAENKDSATDILKLLSLLKEWGTRDSKRWDFQHVKEWDGCVTDTAHQHGTPEEDRGAKAPTAHSPGKMSFAIQENDPKSGAEGQQLEQDVSKQSLPDPPSTGMHQSSTIKTTPAMGKRIKNGNREPEEGSFPGEGRDKSLQMEPVPRTGEPRDGQQTKALREAHRNMGLILKVEHPPVLGSDGCHTWNEESVVYSTPLGGIQPEESNPRALPQDAVFLRFALSHEEMFYARKCHFFLTDVILDSIRQKDPKEITAKITALVNRLWTQQITPKEFVGDLLSMEYFKGDRNVREQLLKWVEFTLPLAWKYSRCLQLLVQRGFALSVSSFTLGM